MERQLKERIVGATVIVAAGIILIPWLLDGSGRLKEGPVEQTLTLPAQGGARSYTIPLDHPATPARTAMPRPDAEPVAPRPDAGSVQRPDSRAGDASPAALPRPAPAAEVARSQAKSAQPRPPAQSEPAGWAVQVGSFSKADNATRLRAQLESGGYEAFVSRAVTDAGTMHRVRVGPVADRPTADKLQARLRAAGQQGRVVSVED